MDDNTNLLSGNVFNPEQLSEHLCDLLTWRQLRKLAKRNGLSQYSYLNKKGLSKLLAYSAFNRHARKNVSAAKQSGL